MSHEVETMAYTNEVPWHGLGHRVDQVNMNGKGAVEAMLKAAKINWTVEREDLFLKDGTPAPAAALVRSTDGSILDVVGPSYVPVQNHEAFEFFREIVEAGDAHLETAGSLRSGKYVWGLANLGESFKLKGNDEVKGYCLVGCPHEQGKAMIFKFTSVRVVCNNTLGMALNMNSTTGAPGELRRSHRNAFDSTALAAAKEAMGISREKLHQFKETAETLRRKSMSRQDAINVLQPIFAPKFDLTDGRMTLDNLTPRMAQLMDILEKAPGAQPDNAWGVLNAVTYYADHVASRTPDKRLFNAWLGKTASQKTQTMKALLAA